MKIKTKKVFTSLYALVIGLLSDNYKSATADLSIRVVGEVQILGILILSALENSKTTSIEISSVILRSITSLIFLNQNYDTYNAQSTLIGITIYFLLSFLLISVAFFQKNASLDQNLTIKRWGNSFLIAHALIFSLYINLFLFEIIQLQTNIKLNLDILIGSIVLTIINNCYAFASARMSYCILFGNNDLGVRTPSPAMISFLFKLIFAIVRTYAKSDFGIYVLIISVLYILLIGREYINMPFYNLKIFCLFITILFIQTSWILAQIVGIVIWDRDVNQIFYIGIISIGCLVRICLGLEDRMILKAMNMSKEIDNKRNYFFKLICYLSIVKNGQCLKFYHDYKIHEYAFIELLKNDNLTSDPAENREIINKFIKRFLIRGVECFKTDELKLIKIYYELNVLNTPDYQTLIELMQLKNAKNGFELGMLTRYLIFMYDSFIMRKTEDEESLSIKEVFVHHNSKSRFVEEIKESTIKYLNFWRKDRKELKLHALLEKSFKMSEEANHLAAIWQDLKKVVSKSSKLEALCYSFYLYCVRNARYSSFKIMKEKVFMPKQEIFIRKGPSMLLRSLEDETAITFLVELHPDGLEKFSYSTKNVKNLGFETFELIGKSVEILIPSIYKSNKRFSLLEYAEKIKGTIISTTFQMYVKSKENCIYEADCYLCPITTENKLSYVFVAIPHLKYTNEFIVCENSMVESWTNDLFHSLNLKRLQATKPQFTIEEMLAFLEARSNEEKDISPLYLNEYHFSNQGSRVKDRLLSIERSRVSSFTSIKSTGEYRMKSIIPKHDQSNIWALYNGKEYLKYRVTTIKTEHSNVFMLKFIKLSDTATYSFYSEDLDEIFNEFAEDYNVKSEATSKKIIPESRAFLDKEEPNDLSTEINKYATQKQNYQASIRSISIMQTNVDLEMENSFYVPKKTVRDQLTNYSMCSYIFLSIFLFMIFLITSVNKIDSLPTILNTAAILYDRHNTLWQWVFFDTGLLLAMIKGYITDRSDTTAQDFWESIFDIYVDMMPDYVENNFKIQKALPLFEPDLQLKFFQKFNIKSLYDPNMQESVTLFEFDSRIVDYAGKLFQYKHINYDEAPSQIDIVDFINYNTLNDQYITEESLYSVIKEDIERKLNYLGYFSLINSVLLLVIALIFYGVILKIERKCIIKKNNFADVLNKIRESEIDKHLSHVENFLNCLQDEVKLMHFYQSLIKSGAKSTEKSNKVSHLKKFELNKFNTSGLNNKNYLLLFAIFMVIGAIVSISFGMQVFLGHSSATILEHVDDSIKASIIFNKLCTVTIPLYEYIIYNGSITVKNRPYSQVFDEYISDLDGIQEFYLSLLDRVDDDLAGELRGRYTNNLCNYANPEDCLPVLEPVVRNGALQMYAFVIKAAVTIKREFDGSSMSFEDKYNIFYSDNYINIEWASYYLPNTTQTIQNILQVQVVRTIDKYQLSLFVTFFVFTVVAIAFLALIWRPIWKELRRQRLNIYEMMKIVPLDIINNNPNLKNFWNKFA